MHNYLVRPARRSALAAARAAVFVAAVCVWACPVRGQSADQPATGDGQAPERKLNRSELCQLLAPVALYPDALVAIILPAATVPSDVVLGARYLAANGDPELAKNQPWDESVISLTRYPDVLAWMDKNLEWTASVGEAFVVQPADVMNALQALRAQAQAAGNLKDSPQQKVVEEESLIRIVPADPQVIYVPQYDPDIVYIQTYSTVPILTFGSGYAVGPWLCYDFDWNRRYICRGHWRGWDHSRIAEPVLVENRGANQLNVVSIDINNASLWRPSANSQRQIIQLQRNNNGNARFVSARSGAVADGQQGIQPRISPGAVQPARSSSQFQSILPRPSQVEGTRNDARHNRAPASTPAANPINISPGNPAQNPVQVNRPIRQQIQEPTRTNPSVRAEPPFAPSGRAEHSEKVAMPVSEALQIQEIKRMQPERQQSREPSSLPAAKPATGASPTTAVQPRSDKNEKKKADDNK